jgi:hypothetical protein
VVQADRGAEEVLQMMEERRMNFAFVIKDNRPVGYLLPKLLKYEHGRVGELAEKFPETMGTREPLRDALSAMLMYDVSDLPVSWMTTAGWRGPSATKISKSRSSNCTRKTRKKSNLRPAKWRSFIRFTRERSVCHDCLYSGKLRPERSF